MPSIANGANASGVLGSQDSIAIDAGGGFAQLEVPTGTVIAQFRGSRVFGPFDGQTFKVTSLSGPIYYELEDGSYAQSVTSDSTGSLVVSGIGQTKFPTVIAGSAAATANTAAINAALAQKGTVVIDRPGTYYINGTLVCYEDTTFRIGAGVTLYRADQTNANMIACAYQAAARTTITSVQAAAVAGTAHVYAATVTFPSAHGLSVGQYVQLWGDTRNIYNGVWKIASVPSSTTLTFWMGRGAIGSLPLDYTTALPAGTGTITANPAVGNLHIDCAGTLDGNGNNQADGWTHYPVYLNKIGHSRCRVRVVNSYWHNISTANDWNVEIHDSYLDSFGVAIQAYGPSRELKIVNCYTESTGDDGFAFLTQDTVTFPTVPPSSHSINGDIIDLTVRDCVFNHVDGSGCVTLFNKPSNGWNCDGIKVHNISCVGSASSMLAFNGNWGSFEARGIRFRGQQMGGASNLSKVGGVEKIFFMAGSQGYTMTGANLEIYDVRQIESFGPAQGWGAQTTRMIDWTNQTAGTVIDRAVIDGVSVYFDTTAYNTSTGYYLALADSGITVNQLTMKNIRAKSNGGTSVAVGVFGPGGMSVKQMICDNWELTGAALNGITANFANTPKITARGCSVLGAKNFIESANYSFDLTVIGPYQSSATAGYFNFYGNGSSGAIDLTVIGARQISGTVFANTPTSNVALKFNNPDGSLPIDGTKATYRSGALFYNSNAAYGTGVGLYAMGASATTRLAA